MTPGEIDQASFLWLVRESRLVEEETLRAALSAAPKVERAKHLARHLVSAGVLTRFQAQQLLVGRSGGFFLGQYRVLDLIGRGGMGKVYKAEHMTMGRVVALKVLNSEVTRSDRALQLFRREVRAAARLVHPNIATAFDANELNGRAFLVLEYISGPSLSQLVREKGPLPVGVACEFVRQAACGLQHAYELGMVHRDVKPSNLILQPPVGRSDAEAGTVKIVDFGLALLPTADESDIKDDERHIVMGTPDYLSPEQARDIRSVDSRSDLYSLGCTFFYLLTGQVPFPGGTAAEKLARHANDVPEAVEGIRPVIPVGVGEIVRRLLAKQPADRFQTPRELADALAAYADARPNSWAVRRVTSEQLSDDATDPPTDGSGAGSSSGSVSLADFASTISGAQHPTIAAPAPRRRWPTGFFWALLLGFSAGLLLIAASLLAQ